MNAQIRFKKLKKRVELYQRAAFGDWQEMDDLIILWFPIIYKTDESDLVILRIEEHLNKTFSSCTPF